MNVHFRPSLLPRLGMLCLPIILLVVNLPSVAFAAPADDEYTFGLTLYGQKRWELAEETFTKYLKDYPEHDKVPLAKVYLAQCYVNQQQYTEARQVLRGFLEDHPENKNLSQAMYRVAECSYFLDDYKASITEFTDFLQKAPEDPLVEWALPYLADAYLRSGNAKEAAATFNQSLEKFPEGRFVEDSYFGLARANELLNNNEKAIELYQKLIAREQGQRTEEAMFNVGMLYFQEQKFDQAAKAFQQLVSQFPESRLASLAHLNAGYAFYSQQQWEKALDEFERTAENATYRTTAQYWIASTLKSQGQMQQAEAEFQKLLRSQPDEDLLPKIQFQLADSQFQLLKYDEAITGFRQYLKDHPRGLYVGPAWISAIEACLQTNRLGTGWEISEQTWEQTLSDATLQERQLLQARLLSAADSEVDPLPEELGDRPARIERARTLLDDLIATLNDNTARITQQARYQAARIELEQQNYAAAINDLLPITAELSNPDQLLLPEARLLLASCYFETQDYQSAIDAVEQLLNNAPSDGLKKQALVVQMNSLTELGQLASAEQILDQLRTSKFDREKLAQATYRIADLAYSQQDWQRAKRLYLQLNQSNPPDEWIVKSMSGLGWTQFELGQFEQSAKTFESLQQRFPESQQVAADAGYMQGMALLKGNQEEQAAVAFYRNAQQFRSAADASEGDEVNLIAFRSAREAARAYRNLSEVEKSAEAYNLAYQELKKQPSARRKGLDDLLDEWALLHYESAQYDEADRIFKILITELPESDRADDAALSLAESDFVAGRIDEARTQFIQLVENPQTDQNVRRRALYQLVLISAEQNRGADLQKYADLYLNTSDPQQANVAEIGEVQTQLIRQLLDDNKLEVAKTQMQGLQQRIADLAEEQKPKWVPAAYVLQAEIARREKDYAQVREILAKILEEYPGSEELDQIQVLAGRAAIAEADFAKAKELFQGVLNRVSGKKTLAAAQSQFYLAESALIQKQYKDALQQYSRMAYLFPGFPELQAAALYQVGQCDEVLNNPTQAIKSYESLISFFPDDPYADKAKERIEALRAQ